MSLHANLRAIDKTRAVQAMTAWTCDDHEALEEVLGQVAGDPDGTNGFVFALLSYADWISRHTGPLLDQAGTKTKHEPPPRTGGAATRP